MLKKCVTTKASLLVPDMEVTFSSILRFSRILYHVKRNLRLEMPLETCLNS